MEFNIKDLEELVEKINKPSVVIYCPSSIVDYLKMNWDEKMPKAQFYSYDYEDDKIYVLPAEEMERPIKFVIP